MLSKILRLVVLVIKAILDSELELGAGQGSAKRSLVQGKIASFLSSEDMNVGELMGLLLELVDTLVKIFNLLGLFQQRAQPQLE